MAIATGSIVRLLLALCLLVPPAVEAGVGEALSFRAPQLFPESFDWDGAHNRFILGSMTLGCLKTVDDSSSSAEEFVRDEEYAGKAAIIGVKVDGKRNRVVVVVHNMDPKQPLFHAVAAYDLDTKKRSLYVLLHTVGVAEGQSSVANDVAVDDAGNLYVTNTAANFIWKVDHEHGVASVFVRSPLFTSQPVIVEGFIVPMGLNGIAYHPHGFLLVGQTNSGVLFKVELEDQETTVLRTEPLLRELDGVRVRDANHAVVVSTHTVWLLSSRTDWATAKVLESVSLNQSSFATTAAIRDGRTFLLNSFMHEMWSGLDREQFALDEVRFPVDDENDPTSLIITLVVAVVALVGWRKHLNNFNKKYQERRVTKFDVAKLD